MRWFRTRAGVSCRHTGAVAGSQVVAVHGTPGAAATGCPDDSAHVAKMTAMA